jgi:hypothetical protein
LRTRLSIQVRGYYNRVLALGPPSLDARRLSRQVAAEPLFARARRELALRRLA